MKGEKLDGICSTHERDEECMKGSTTWKNWAYIG
jgi:hypothetical protein